MCKSFSWKKWDSDEVHWSSGYNTDDSDYNSDGESNSNVSIIANATETEQNQTMNLLEKTLPLMKILKIIMNTNIH